MNVKIGFSKTNAVLSRLIRLVTRAAVSHSFILYSDPLFGQDMVMEASNSGFRIITFAQFQKDNTVVDLIELPPSSEKGLALASNWLGTAYDYLGLFGEAFVQFARWFKRKVKNPLASSTKMVCSEAVTLMLQGINYPGADALIPESTSPEDLLIFLQSKPISLP